MALLIADTNEFHPVNNASAYASWSPAIIMRAHNGTREDTAYAASRTQVDAEPAIRVRGHYGYVQASVDAAQQGRDFAAIVTHRGGIKPGDFICWDLEEGAGDQAVRANTWMQAAHGVLADPVSDEFGYSGANYWAAHLASVNNVHRWIAAYGQAQPAFNETFWQFTDAQTVPGVAGPCDCSRFDGTIDQLLALINPSVPPTPTNLPVKEDTMVALIGERWELIIVGEAKDNGNTLVMRVPQQGNPTVTDLTDAIGKDSAGREYRVI